MVKKFSRLTKKESSYARRVAIKILLDLNKRLRGKYRFTFRMVGSTKWGTNIRKKNGEYDVDYQILLTKNSKKYKENQLSNPTEIKNDFFNECKMIVHNGKVENSTTAITVYLKDNMNINFHIDFVIIKIFPDNGLIIKRNNKKETFHINEFTWCELMKHNDAFLKFKELTSNEKKDLIENYIIEAKVKEIKKEKGDPTKLSSTEVFIREVNNYVSKKFYN